MLKFKFVKKEKIADLPTASGVYSFEKGADFLYIGKAVNIKERVQNHFQQPSFKDNIFIPETEKIGFIATNSEIEALILEAELIKKFQPKYNTVWRDGKSHNYVFITKEKFPRVFVGHISPKISNGSPMLTTSGFQWFAYAHHLRFPISKKIGPFVDGKALKQTLRLLRRIFPYRTCKILPKKSCLYKELNLCQAPCVNQITKKEHTKNIQNLEKILQGKKPQVLNTLQKEMKTASQIQDYEKARSLRDQIFALENVFAHSHIVRPQGSVIWSVIYDSWGVANLNWIKIEKELQKLLNIKTNIKRIEGYDISNIQGREATGGLVVFNNGLPDKNEYRKFKIKITGKPNDTAMLKEIIVRRLRHRDWSLPQIMLIDGGKAQLNAAIAALKSEILNPKSETISNFQNPKFKTIKIISLAKRNNELFIKSEKEPILLKNLPQEMANLILHIRNEAHRFAVSYHRKLRSKSRLPK